jgi:pyruvate-ferredoxin/flavodoxin oxidoreductase
MDKVSVLTGRPLKLFEWIGEPDAERCVVIMGSGSDNCKEVVKYL